VTPAISVEGLYKSYGTVDAVRGINLEVQIGEVFGLLGPNGAGKTTTVEILESLRPRTSGAVSVLGFDPATSSKEIKNRIGVCLQATNLPDKMKTIEALELFAAFYDRQTDRNALLKRLQLWDKRDAFYRTLSGGQKQRVALALALLNEPEILFLDEPTTGLDPQVRLEIHNVIQELKESGKTILLTTHYIEEAERLCDRVAILDEGKIIEQGTPREIQRRVLGETQVEVTATGRIPVEDMPQALRAGKSALSDDGRTLSLQTE
jgi:ABC-2 type transport system ATP-binding protein